MPWVTSMLNGTNYTPGVKQKSLGVSPICTTEIMGMGVSAQAWACPKRIMPPERIFLGEEQVERLSIFSTAYKLDTARIK